MPALMVNIITAESVQDVMPHALRAAEELLMIVSRAQQGDFWTGQAAQHVMYHARRVMGGLPMIVCRALALFLTFHSA